MIRFAAASRQVLDRFAADPLPAPAQADEAVPDFYRDVFYDTPGRDLERRGVTVRLRIRPEGARRLSVDVRERSDTAGEVVRTSAEAEIAEVEIEEAFMGTSEPARLLRAITDPERLQPQLELETMRRRRRVRLEGAPDARVLLDCDEVTLRHGELSGELMEVRLQLPRGEVPGAEELVRALQGEEGLRVTLAGKLARARELLDSLDLAGLEAAIRGAREVAVIAQWDGRIALREERGRLRVPAGPGWGEESCRQVLKSLFGRSQGQIRPLGRSAGVGTRPAVEVWLAQRVAHEEEHAQQEGVHWLPLEEVLQRVGSPELRDASTLAALHLAARHGLPREPDAPWSARALSRKEHPFRLSGAPLVQRREAPPEPDQPSPSGPPPEQLINMELSELAFNERVLALASDPSTPLLERVKFLSILGSNLDEFFMTRVAGFHQQVASGSRKRTLDGLTPEEQLDVIAVRARALLGNAYRFLWERLVPDLEEAGIDLLTWSDLDEGDLAYLADNYASQLGAVLTPLAADPSHPFPHIRNLRPALAVVVRLPETGVEQFAAIELPGDLPRLVPLPGGRRFIPLEEVIEASLPSLYAGLEVQEAHMFRVTRSANFSLEEEAVSDLLRAVEEKVQQRPLGPVVRLEVESTMPENMRELLLRELQFETRDGVSTLREEDVYQVDRLVDLFGLRDIAALPIEELHYPPLQRSCPLDDARPIWPQLREREVLVRFPHDSFEGTVERLLSEAVRDDKVVSVRITLYRTNRSSRVVKLLRKARRKGKEVLALVELKASFDEKRNIEWARSLESAGIHVVFGPAHLKVHAKVALVIRKEQDGLRRYVYIGTGNLNAATAAGYTDLGLLTTDPDLGEEVQEMFNGLTGYSVSTEYEHLLVAPFNMRDRFLRLIEREAEHARAGRGGHIRVKLNGLTDREVIDALYRASQAGVRIEMIVRGLCSLRPGVPGVSENISVTSVLGRFLEHARIYRFDNAGQPEYFIGSADWRPRNLSRRVEVVTPIRDPEHRRVLDEIMEDNLQNPERWVLQPEGGYRRPDAD